MNAGSETKKIMDGLKAAGIEGNFATVQAFKPERHLRTIKPPTKEVAAALQNLAKLHKVASFVLVETKD